MCGWNSRSVIYTFLYSVCHLNVKLKKEMAKLQTVFCYVGLEVLTAVVLKSTIFWDVMSCSPLRVNWRFGGTYHLHLQGRKISWARNQAICSSETSVDSPTEYMALYPRRWYSSVFCHLVPKAVNCLNYQCYPTLYSEICIREFYLLNCM
jgi:hypothetical protein